MIIGFTLLLLSLLVPNNRGDCYSDLTVYPREKPICYPELVRQIDDASFYAGLGCIIVSLFLAKGRKPRADISGKSEN